MSHQPALSILIPWCERDELQLTLAANRPAFETPQAEVLVLNCGGDDERVRRLIAASEAPRVRQLDIGAPRFNKSLALNVGIAHSRSEIICVLDADVALLGDGLLQAAPLTRDGAFVTVEWVYESQPEKPAAVRQSELAANFTSLTDDFVASLVSGTSMEFHFHDGSKVQHQLTRQDPQGNRRAGPGLLLAARRDLMAIQGYNSDLQCWGWEDDDVLVRLQHVVGLRREQVGEALHLTHGDDRRMLRGSRRQSDQVNFIKCCRNYNHGMFMGTYRTDVASAVTEAPVLGEPATERVPDFPLRTLPNDCGHEDGDSGHGRGRPPASIEQLLVEAALWQLATQDAAILYVGNASPGFAARVSTRCRRLTMADGVLSDNLPLGSYGIVAVGCCCQRHLKSLAAGYAALLAPGGRLLTVEGSLADLAAEAGLTVTRSACGVYSLLRR
jgi:glycosyltransferase involved in cell wall biosynthesis